MTTRPCGKKDCTGEGKWHPVLLVAPWVGYKGELAKMALSLVICDGCKATAEAADFLSDEGWAQIVTVFRRIGKADPCREATSIGFEPAGKFKFAGGGFSGA